MSRLKLVLALSILLVFGTARAEYEIPADNQVLSREGEPSTSPAATLRVLVWNIHKASAGDEWLHDFGLLTAQADVSLLQEGYMIPVMERAQRANNGFQWFFATAFMLKGTGTGVFSGSRWPTEEALWFRSPDREPVINTPKMAMALKIPLIDGRKLMVMNIHSLNFTPNSYFERQLVPLAAEIHDHVGPVLFAGDFNTWNKSRTTYLTTILGSVGMKEVRLEDDHRKLKLDHVFVRDLTTLSAKLRGDVKSSDHSPIQAVFSLIPLPNPRRSHP